MSGFLLQVVPGKGRGLRDVDCNPRSLVWGCSGCGVRMGLPGYFVAGRGGGAATAVLAVGESSSTTCFICRLRDDESAG